MSTKRDVVQGLLAPVEARGGRHSPALRGSVTEQVTQGAQVHQIALLRDLYEALAKFAVQARAALDGAEQEIRPTMNSSTSAITT